MVALAWVKTLLLAALLLQGRVATASRSRGSTQALTGAQGNAQNAKDSSGLQLLQVPEDWGHMARECATLAKPLNKDGGN